MPDYAKPLPIINDLNRPHWEGARRREFRGPALHRMRSSLVSADAQLFRLPQPRIRVIEVSVKALCTPISSTTRGGFRATRDDLPYNVAIIELDEGIRLNQQCCQRLA